MSILSSETKSTDTKIQMSDEKLRDALAQAAAAKQQVNIQNEIKAAAESLQELEKEHAKRVAISQGIDFLNDTKQDVTENLKDIKQRVADFHNKVSQLESLLAEVRKERVSLNGEIRSQALNIKRATDYLQSLTGYHPSLEFSQHWRDCGGEDFNLNVKPELLKIIDERGQTAYTGRSQYFNKFGR